MKSHHWVTTLIGLAMFALIGLIVAMAGWYFWHNSNLRTALVNGTPSATPTLASAEQGKTPAPPQEYTPIGDVPTVTTDGNRLESRAPTSVATRSPAPTPTATALLPSPTRLPPSATLPLPPTRTPNPPTATPLPPPTNTPPPPPPTQSLPGGNYTVSDDNGAMLALINQARCGQGLYPITYNQQLYEAALRHSIDMALNNFFSHTGSDGSQPWDRVSAQGYIWVAIGENVAGGQTNPADTFNSWWNSSPHQANMLNPDFREMGLAHVIRDGSQWVHYWTLVVASRGTDPISCAEAGF